MNKLQNALECLNKANELISPVNPEIIASIGAVYKKTGDYENAEKYTLLAIKEKNDSRFIFNLATIYRDQGKINKAQELYEKVVESNPNFAEAYNNLGEVNRDLG